MISVHGSGQIAMECLAVGAWMICICYFNVFGLVNMLMHVLFDVLPLLGIDIELRKWLTA